MKKVILTIAAVACAMAMNAQWVIGGQVSLSTEGGHYDRYINDNHYVVPNDQSTTLTLLPKVGYNFNERFQVGLNFGITCTSGTDYSQAGYEASALLHADYENWSHSSVTGWKVAPYVRYNFAEFGKFTAFVEGEVALYGLGRGKVHEYEHIGDVIHDDEYIGNTSNFGVDINVVPGLNFAFSPKFSADLYIDLLSLGFSSKTTTHYDNQVDDINRTETNNNFYIGALANARTLSSHLGWFRLGFNIHL